MVPLPLGPFKAGAAQAREVGEAVAVVEKAQARKSEAALARFLGWQMVGLGRRMVRCPACGVEREVRVAEDLLGAACPGCGVPIVRSVVERIERAEGTEAAVRALAAAGVFTVAEIESAAGDGPLYDRLEKSGATGARRVLVAEPDGGLAARPLSSLIDDALLDEALAVKRALGGRIGTIVFALAARAEREALLAQAAEEEGPSGPLDLDAMDLDPALARLISPGLATEHRAVPVEREGSRLVCAMADPLDFAAIDQLRLVLGKDIVARPASEDAVFRAIDRLYGDEEPSEMPPEEMAEVSILEGETGAAAPWPDTPPGVQDLDRLLAEAIDRDLLRIDLEPHPDVYAIRFRSQADPLSGSGTRRTIPRARGVDLVRRLAIVAGLPAEDAGGPVTRSGRFEQAVRGKEREIALSLVATVAGDAASVDIRPRAPAFRDVGAVGFFPGDRRALSHLARERSGLVIVASPPGGGRTTMLDALLLARDPMRHRTLAVSSFPRSPIPGVTYLSPRTADATSMREALAGLLPDTVAIDPLGPETARLAAEAALDGAWVGATVVASDARRAVEKLLLAGLEMDFLARLLRGVALGRLVPVLCRRCRVSHHPDPDELRRAGMRRRLKATSRGLPLGTGCAACGDAGYTVRRALIEVAPGATLLAEREGGEGRDRDGTRLQAKAFRALGRGLVAWPDVAALLR